MRRKWTKAELDQMLEMAKEVMTKECQSWHPRIDKLCQRQAGHPGYHQWRYSKWSKVWKWEE